MTTAGAKALRKIQLGREATPGTAVAATTLWRGIAMSPNDDQVKVQPEENIGFTSKTSRQYTPALLASMEFAETNATFEQLLHILEAGVKTVSPSADGVGSGKIYVYPMATADSQTIKTYTLEGGNNKTVEEMEYAFVKEFTLSGKKKEEWKVSATWEGRQASASAFTGAIAVPAVYPMLFQKTKLYIDAVGGTIGTTQIANSFIEFALKFTTGWRSQHTGDGNLYFSYPEYIGATAELELTLLHNATTAAERAYWRSDTPRQIRLKCEGAALTTPGTAYTYRTFMVDVAGVYTQFPAPNEEDEGSDVYKVVFQVGYDATAALACQFTDVCELASVP